MDTTTRSNETTRPKPGEHAVLMRELGDVAHGLRTAASALTEEHAVMAGYATRAANLVEGAVQRLTPAAALLGFVGTRILSRVGALGAAQSKKAERAASERDETERSDSAHAAGLDNEQRTSESERQESEPRSTSEGG